jgi:hypothetical protein
MLFFSPCISPCLGYPRQRVISVVIILLSCSPVEARGYEDREAGIRIEAPAGWRFATVDDGDWKFTQRSFVLNVLFDFAVEGEQANSGLEAARAYARDNQDLFLLLQEAKAVASGTLSIGGESAVATTYQGRGRSKAKGILAFLARPGCVVIFHLESTLAGFPIHNQLFRTALAAVQLFDPELPDAARTEIKVREMADIGLKVPVPAAWKHRQEDLEEHYYEGRQGELAVVAESSQRYVPSDAQLVVRTVLEQLRELKPKIQSEGSLVVHGWPAYVARYHFEEEGVGGYGEALTVICGEKLCRMDLHGLRKNAPYLQALAERIRAEWRFEKEGPGEAGRPGELKYAPQEVAGAGVAFEMPADWRAPDSAREGARPGAGRVAIYSGGLARIVVATAPLGGLGGVPTPEAGLRVMLEAMGAAAGGKAKVVARQPRPVPGLHSCELVVFTVTIPDEGVGKGWILLARRNDEMLVISLAAQEAFYPALRPTMEHLLKTLRSTRPSSDIARVPAKLTLARYSPVAAPAAAAGSTSPRRSATASAAPGAASGSTVSPLR